MRLRRWEPGRSYSSVPSTWPDFAWGQQAETDLLSGSEVTAKVKALLKEGLREVHPGGVKTFSPAWRPRFFERLANKADHACADYYSLEPYQNKQSRHYIVRHWRLWDDDRVTTLLARAKRLMQHLAAYARDNDPQPPRSISSVKPTRTNPHPLIRTVVVLKIAPSVAKASQAHLELSKIALTLGYGLSGTPDTLDLRGMTAKQVGAVFEMSKKWREVLHPDWSWPGRRRRQEDERLKRHHQLGSVSEGLLALQDLHGLLDRFSSTQRVSRGPLDRALQLRKLRPEVEAFVAKHARGSRTPSSTPEYGRALQRVFVAVGQIAEQEWLHRQRVAWWNDPTHFRPESWGGFAGRHFQTLLKASGAPYTPASALTLMRKMARDSTRQANVHLGWTGSTVRSMPLPRNDQVRRS